MVARRVMSSVAVAGCLCTTSVQDRRFRDGASLRRLCPEAIGVLKTDVKCRPPPPPGDPGIGFERDSIHVHLRSSAVTSGLVAASEAALGPLWLALSRFLGFLNSLTHLARILVSSTDDRGLAAPGSVHTGSHKVGRRTARAFGSAGRSANHCERLICSESCTAIVIGEATVCTPVP